MTTENAEQMVAVAMGAACAICVAATGCMLGAVAYAAWRVAVGP